MNDKQFGVLGLGRFGESLAVTLSELGAEVIVVDKSEEKIQNIANQVTYAVQADVSDLNALKSIGLKNVDVAVISITSDINSNIMAVINCQELGIKEIYSKANNRQHEKVLLKLGVENVFSPATVCAAFVSATRDPSAASGTIAIFTPSDVVSSLINLCASFPIQLTLS